MKKNMPMKKKSQFLTDIKNIIAQSKEDAIKSVENYIKCIRKYPLTKQPSFLQSLAKDKILI